MPHAATETLATSPEIDLAIKARDGDRLAFGRLWDRFAPVVHGILLTLVPSFEVQDMMQDVSLSALRAIDGLKDPRAVAGWFCTIARNRARDHWKARRHGIVDRLDDDVVDPGPIEEIGDDRGSRILAVIRGMPETYREVLILRLVEGLSGPEIARLTDLTPGSVRVTLCRGMKILRELLVRENLA